MKRPDVHIRAGAYLCAAAAILLLPLNWLAGWMIAVTVHEAGHLAALGCFRVPIFELEIGFLGARISAGTMTPMQELLCAAAGPVCSFLLLAVAPQFPVAALIGLVQGLFNLFPVYPLDGGRMLRSVITMVQK